MQLPSEEGIELGDVYAFRVPENQGLMLCIGIPPGRVRPALWASVDGTVRILAQFHSVPDASSAAVILTTIMGAVQRAIDFHNKGTTDGQSA